MRFKVGLTFAERKARNADNESEQERINQWHPHFCVWPRRVGHLLVWLELVERKRVEEWYGYTKRWVWYYRTPDQAEHPMNSGGQ
jgi:hypothetical protein